MKIAGHKSFGLLAVIAAVFFVYAFGLAQLNADPISGPEHNSLKHLYASHGAPSFTIAETLASISTRSNEHGPLYFLILGLWRDLVGRDLFTYRLLSLFFGLLAICFTYRLALITGHFQTAIDAAVLVAFMSYFVVYLHEVRMYSLLPLVASVVLWSYWRIAKRRERVQPALWLLLITISTAILYLHYFGIFVLAAIGIYHLLWMPKNRRWLTVCLAMLLVALLFSPWLNVVIQALADKKSLLSSRLAFHDSMLVLSSAYTNGFPIVALGAAITIAVLWGRLGNAARFLGIIALSILLLMVGINEIEPILAERRIRYTIILAIPWACALAIALNTLPNWKRWRIPFFAFWIASFFVFNDSDDLLVYTNVIAQNYHIVPHYQRLVYDPAIPKHNGDFLISFHPDNRPDLRTLNYYRAAGGWRGPLHIWQPAPGDAAIQTPLSSYADFERVAAEVNGAWVTFNPQLTNPHAMSIYSDWFLQHFKACKRYIEAEHSIVDYYVQNSIPCELINAEIPLTIKYDNGSILGNAHARMEEEALAIYLRWLKPAEDQYSYSLQVIDALGDKAAQLDRVMGDEPIEVVSLDLSGLPAGEYDVDFVVYEFESGESVSGVLASSGRRFDRTVKAHSFTLEM